MTFNDREELLLGRAMMLHELSILLGLRQKSALFFKNPVALHFASFHACLPRLSVQVAAHKDVNRMMAGVGSFNHFFSWDLCNTVLCSSVSESFLMHTQPTPLMAC